MKEKTEEKNSEQPFERTSRTLPFNKIVMNNFIGGISWGLGATIGVSIFFTLFTLIAKSIDFNLIPVVGSFASQVVDFVLANNPNLNK